MTIYEEERIIVKELEACAKQSCAYQVLSVDGLLINNRFGVGHAYSYSNHILVKCNLVLPDM